MTTESINTHTVREQAYYHTCNGGLSVRIDEHTTTYDLGFGTGPSTLRGYSLRLHSSGVDTSMTMEMPLGNLQFLQYLHDAFGRLLAYAKMQPQSNYDAGRTVEIAVADARPMPQRKIVTEYAGNGIAGSDVESGNTDLVAAELAKK